MPQFCPSISQLSQISHCIKQRRSSILKLESSRGGLADGGADKGRSECHRIYSTTYHRLVSSETLARWNRSLRWNTIVGVAPRRQTSSQAGYWPLWTWLQYLGQLMCPCFKFLLCCQRNNSAPIHVASWAQHDIWKCMLSVPFAHRRRLNMRPFLFSNAFICPEHFIEILIWGFSFPVWL